MKKIILPLILICTLGCSDKFMNWKTYSDQFNIGSILMPTIPNEIRDTTTNSKFKLVSSVNVAALVNKKNSPSAFSYDLYFPTVISDFDFFEMKKDSNTVNKLFENMIKGAQRKSNSEVIEKSYFKYPEPGVKVTLLNSATNTMGVYRIIIFDNYVIVTSATGNKESYSNAMEEDYFKTLKIKPVNRNRN